MANFRSKSRKSGQRKRQKPFGQSNARKWQIIAAVSVLAIAAAGYGAYYLLMKSAYFEVTEAVFSARRAVSTVDYDAIEARLEGRNIFSLDLKGLESSIAGEYPELLGLTVRREFPGRVVLDMRYRLPVAQVKRGRYYLVDADGVVLPGAAENPRADYPVIGGVNARFDRLIGKRCDSRLLKKALYLLQRIEESGLLEEYMLSEIDVSNTYNISFYLDDGLEIKIGGEDFTVRLGRLARLLADPKIKPAEIRYIDLRFRDPVVNPKWIR